MVCILLNHLSLYPSIWQYLTGRGGMWISAAEGFFFISGAMIGISRGKEYIDKNGMVFTSKKLLQRSFKLYVVYVLVSLLSILFFLGLNKIGINPSPATLQGNIHIKNINLELWSVMTFEGVYGWADFLKYYVIYMILSIPLLWLLRKQMWYFVIGLVVLFWFQPRLAKFPFEPYYFYWLSYFILGILFGYYNKLIKHSFYSMSPKIRLYIVNSIIIFAFFILFFNWLNNFYTIPYNINFESTIRSLTLYRWKPNILFDPYFYNDRTGILRLPLFLIVMSAIIFMFKKFENFIKYRLDWLLGEFGRNSLTVYVVGAIFTYFFRLWVVDTSFIYNSIVSFIFIILILYTSKNKLIKKILTN